MGRFTPGGKTTPSLGNTGIENGMPLNRMNTAVSFSDVYFFQSTSSVARYTICAGRAALKKNKNKKTNEKQNDNRPHDDHHMLLRTLAIAEQVVGGKLQSEAKTLLVFFCLHVCVPVCVCVCVCV